MLTQAKLRELFFYDPEVGQFVRKITRGPCVAGEIAGHPDKDGYLRICIDGKQYSAHRLAFLYVTGSWPGDKVDHENGVVTDNRFANLRDNTARFNSQNQRRARNTDGRTSTHLGVWFEKKSGKFRAQIRLDGRQTSLGSFDIEADASAAYLAAKRQHHQGNTL